MLLLSLISAAALAASQSQGYQSNYSRVIQHPNPNNGYEDYIRATDVAHGDDLGQLLGFTPQAYDQMLADKQSILAGQGGDSKGSKSEWTKEDEANLAIAKELHELGYLGVQRRLSDEYGRAMDFVRQGNLKAAWDPREKKDAASMFPEMAGFKSVARIFRSDAYVKLADGNSKAGTADLLDGLTFANRIGGTILISELVSIACRSIILAEFEAELPRLSDRDAKEIIAYADSALGDQSGLSRAFLGERDMALSTLGELFKSPKILGDMGTDAPAGLQDFVAKMSPSDRDQAMNQLTNGLSDFYSGWNTKLGDDESKWASDQGTPEVPPMPQSVKSVQDLVDTLIQLVTPTFSQAVLAELKTRAQLRLLGLHARIIDFRWKNNRLPHDLKEAVPEKLLHDPMSGDVFQYQLTEFGGYKLFSKGLSSTGPIELKFKRMPGLPGSDDDQGIPPP